MSIILTKEVVQKMFNEIVEKTITGMLGDKDKQIVYNYLQNGGEFMSKNSLDGADKLDMSLRTLFGPKVTELVEKQIIDELGQSLRQNPDNSGKNFVESIKKIFSGFKDE